MGEMAPTVSDPNHRLDDKDALRHPGGLPQLGLGDVESHSVAGWTWLGLITLRVGDRLAGCD